MKRDVSNGRRRYELTDDDGFASGGETGSILDAQFLNYVETSVLRDSVGDAARSGDDGERLGLVGQFFKRLSEDIPKDDRGPSQLSRSSPLRVLGKPLGFFDLRRRRKAYQAFISLPEPTDETKIGDKHSAADQVARHLVELQMQMFDPLTVSVEDDLFREVLRQRLNVKDGELPRPPVDPSDPADHVALARPLVSFLSRQLAGMADANEKLVDTDTFLRAETLAWLAGVHRNSVLRASAATGGSSLSDDRFADAFDVLPVVYAGSLSTKHDIAYVLCATPIDPWFADESIPSDVARMPDIFFALFQAPRHAPLIRTRSRVQLESELTTVLSSLTVKKIARDRGVALKVAAGEGAKISRSWFGEGVAELLGRETSDAHLKNETTLDFWTRFVEELLCRKIPGVRSTETFPFDRAFIIADTGGAPSLVSATSPGLRVRALEAALESVAPVDRFLFKSSFERVDRDLQTEFDVTSKVIKFRHDFDISRSPSGHIEMTRLMAPQNYVAGSRLEPQHARLKAFGLKKYPSAALHSKAADIALEAMISYAGAGDGAASLSNRTANANNLRSRFTREGFLFDFAQRAKFCDDFPLLSAINRLYLEECASGAGGRIEETFWDRQKNGEVEAKVVVISFEPLLSQQNKRDSAASPTGPGGRPTSSAGATSQDYYLSPAESKVTIILIADEDTEKSVPDVESEREDLRLLGEMIFRQRLRDRQREVDFLEKRVNVVQSLTEGFFHKMKASLKIREMNVDERIGELESQWGAIRRAVQFDRNSMDKVGPFPSSLHYLAAIWFLDDEAQSDLAHMDEADLHKIVEQSLIERVRIYARQYAMENQRPVDLSPTFELFCVPVPEMLLELPVKAVRECFDVAIKNAVEAALAEGAPPAPRVRVVVQHSFDPVSALHSFDLCVENTTLPIAPEVWKKLTDPTPVHEGLHNKFKASSTGIGVFASRQLLRNGLGARADIRYLRLSDTVVQARIQLPAEPRFSGFTRTAEEEARLDALNISQAEIGDIILLEDQAEFAEQTIGAIRRAAPGLKIVWVNTYDAFRKAIDLGLPKLVISDLNVPERDPDGAASKKFGLEALEYLGERARVTKTFPPVWIASNEQAEVALKDLTDRATGAPLTGADYKIVRLNDAGDPLAGGVLLVLGVKHLNGDGKVSALADRLADLQVSTSAVGPVTRSPAPKRAEISIVAPGITTFADAYAQVQDRKVAPGFVFADASAHDLRDALEAWFTLPAMPVLGDRPGARPRSVTEPTFHERVALLVSDPVTAPLPASVRYWFLKNNIIVASEDPHSLASKLLKIKRETSGPIAAARHDLKNFYKESPEQIERLSKHLQDLLEGPGRRISGLDLSIVAQTRDQRIAAFDAVLDEESKHFNQDKAGAAYAEFRSHIKGLAEDDLSIEAQVSELIRSLDTTMILLGLGDHG